MLDQERLVEQYGRLIHYVLRHQGIGPQHDAYGDYFNELYIKLVDLAGKFRGDPLDEKARGRFVGYAKPALRRALWALTHQDWQRRVATDSGEDAVTTLASHDTTDVLAVVEYLADAERVLSAADYATFQVAADGRWSVTEKAQILGVSRKGYYQKLKRILRKLEAGCLNR